MPPSTTNPNIPWRYARERKIVIIENVAYVNCFSFIGESLAFGILPEGYLKHQKL